MIEMKAKHALIIALYGIVCFILSLLICNSGFAFETWLERCEPYRMQVEKALTDGGLSADYYFLMVAESRCTPKARSSAGALGFWQLMPRTSRKYGCTNPADLQCATVAAVAYLKRLESEFDSFRDVVIAWNMGGHNYKRIGKPTVQAVDLYRKVQRLKRLNRQS